MSKALDGKVEVTIDPSDDIYGTDGRDAIIRKFHELRPSTKVVGMGAGAAGLMPELWLLLAVGASAVASGFLQALGADVYEKLKNAILKTADIRPKPTAPSLPPDYKGEIYTNLMWRISFQDTSLLIELGLIDEETVEKALSNLPIIIDQVLKTSHDRFIRLIWDGKGWKRL